MVTIDSHVTKLLTTEQKYLKLLDGLGDAFAAEVFNLCSTATAIGVTSSPFPAFIRDIGTLRGEVRAFIDEVLLVSQTDGAIAEIFCRYSGLLHAHLRYARTAIDIQATFATFPKVIFPLSFHYGRSLSINCDGLTFHQILQEPLHHMIIYLDWLEQYNSLISLDSEESVNATRAIAGVQAAVHMLADSDTAASIVAAGQHFHTTILPSVSHMFVRSGRGKIQLEIAPSYSSSSSSSGSNTPLHQQQLSIGVPTNGYIYIFSNFIMIGIVSVDKVTQKETVMLHNILPLHYACQVGISNTSKNSLQPYQHSIFVSSSGVHDSLLLDQTLSKLVPQNAHLIIHTTTTYSLIFTPEPHDEGEAEFYENIHFADGDQSTKKFTIADHWLQDLRFCIQQNNQIRNSETTNKTFNYRTVRHYMMKQSELWQTMAKESLNTSRKPQKVTLVPETTGPESLSQPAHKESLTAKSTVTETSTVSRSDSLQSDNTIYQYKFPSTGSSNDTQIPSISTGNIFVPGASNNLHNISLPKQIHSCTDLSQLLLSIVYKEQQVKEGRTTVDPSQKLVIEGKATIPFSDGSQRLRWNTTISSSTDTLSSPSTASVSRTMWEDIPMSLVTRQLLQPKLNSLQSPPSTVSSRNTDTSTYQPNGLWLRMYEPGAAAELLCNQGSKSYEQLLSVYAKAGQPATAIAFAVHCRSYGIEPTANTFMYIGKAMLEADQLNTLLELHSCVPSDIRIGSLNGVVLEGYAKYGLPEKAATFLNEMRKNKMIVTADHYAYLVRAYGNTGDLAKAIKVVRDVCKEALEWRANPNSLLSDTHIVIPDTPLMNALIEAASVCHEPHVARAVFESLVRNDPSHAQAVGITTEGNARTSPGNSALISSSAARILLPTLGSRVSNDMYTNASSSHLQSNMDTGIGSLSYLSTSISCNTPSHSKLVRSGQQILADLQKSTLYELIDTVQQSTFERRIGSGSVLSPTASTYEQLIAAYANNNMREQAEAVLEILMVRCEVERKRGVSDFKTGPIPEWTISALPYEVLLKFAAQVGDISRVQTLLEHAHTVKVAPTALMASYVVSVLGQNKQLSSTAAQNAVIVLQDSVFADYPVILHAYCTSAHLSTSTIQALIQQTSLSKVPLQLPLNIYKLLLTDVVQPSERTNELFTSVFDRIHQARITVDASFVKDIAVIIRKCNDSRSPTFAVSSLQHLLRLDETGFMRTGETACTVASLCSTLGMTDIAYHLLQNAPFTPGCAAEALAVGYATYISVMASGTFSPPHAGTAWLDIVNQLLSSAPISECLRYTSIVASDTSNNILVEDREWIVAKGIEAVTLGNTIPKQGYVSITARHNRSVAIVLHQFSIAFTAAIRGTYRVGLRNKLSVATIIANAVEIFGAYLRFLSWHSVAHTIWRNGIAADVNRLCGMDSVTGNWCGSQLYRKSVVLEASDGISGPWSAILEVAVKSFEYQRSTIRVLLPDDNGVFIEPHDTPADIAIRLFDLMVHEKVFPTSRMVELTIGTCVKSVLGLSAELIIDKAVNGIRRVCFDETGNTSIPLFIPVSMLSIASDWFIEAVTVTHSIVALRFAAAAQARWGTILSSIWRAYYDHCSQEMMDIRDCSGGILSAVSLDTVNAENKKVATLMIEKVDPEGRKLLHHDVLLNYLHAIEASMVSASIADRLSTEGMEAHGESSLLAPSEAVVQARQAVVEFASGGSILSLHIHASIASLYARAGLMADARLLLRLLLAPVSGEDYTHAKLTKDAVNDASKLGEDLNGINVPIHFGGSFLLERISATDAALVALGVSIPGFAFGVSSLPSPMVKSTLVVDNGSRSKSEDMTTSYEIESIHGLASILRQMGDIESYTSLIVDSSSFCSIVAALGAASMGDEIRQLVDHAAETVGCLDLIAALCTYSAFVEAGQLSAAEAILNDARFDFKTVSVAHGERTLDPHQAMDTSFGLLWNTTGTVYSLSYPPVSFARGITFSSTASSLYPVLQQASQEYTVALLQSLRIYAHCTNGQIHTAFRMLEQYVSDITLHSMDQSSSSESNDNSVIPAHHLLKGIFPEAISTVLMSLARLNGDVLVAAPTDDAPISATALPYVRANALLEGINNEKEPNSNGVFSRNDDYRSNSTRLSTASILERLTNLSSTLQSLNWIPSRNDICALMRIYALASRPLSALLLGWITVQSRVLSKGLRTPHSSGYDPLSPVRSVLDDNGLRVLRPNDFDNIIGSLINLTTEFELQETGNAAYSLAMKWLTESAGSNSKVSSLSKNLLSSSHPRHPEPGSTMMIDAPDVYELLSTPDILAALLWVYATAPRQLYEAGAVSTGLIDIIRSIGKRMDIGIGSTMEALMDHIISRIRLAGSKPLLLTNAQQNTGTTMMMSTAPWSPPRSASMATSTATTVPHTEVTTANDVYDVRPIGLDIGPHIASFLSRHLINFWLPTVQPDIYCRLPLYPLQTTLAITKNDVVSYTRIQDIIENSFDKSRLNGAPSMRALVSLCASIGYGYNTRTILRQPQPNVQYAYALTMGLRGKPRVPLPIDVNAFIASMGITVFRITGKVKENKVLPLLPKPVISQLGGTSKGSFTSLRSPSKTYGFGTVDDLDEDTSRVEAQVLVLQMELDELHNLMVATEVDLERQKEENLRNIQNEEIPVIESTKDSMFLFDEDSATIASKKSVAVTGQKVQRLKQQANVLRAALNILIEEEEQLNHESGLNSSARGLLTSHNIAEKRTQQSLTSLTNQVTSAAAKISAAETEILHALSGAVSTKRLPLSAMAAPALVQAQTIRLVHQEKTRVLEDDETKSYQQTAPLVAIEAFARQKKRGNAHMTTVVESLSKELTNINDDLENLNTRETQLRDWTAALTDVLHLRENEGTRNSVQPFLGALEQVQKAQMQLESAKARHAIDRRLAVAGRLDDAVADVRNDGEKMLNDTRAKYAKDAEAWTLEYRRKCENAQDQLRRALEAELMPVAAVADAEGRAATERKAAVMRELSACDEALAVMTRENAALSHAISDTLVAVNILKSGIVSKNSYTLSTSGTRDDIRQDIMATAGDTTTEPDLLLRVLEDIEALISRDPLGLSSSLTIPAPKESAASIMLLDSGGTVTSTALTELIDVYEEECRRHNLINSNTLAISAPINEEGKDQFLSLLPNKERDGTPSAATAEATAAATAAALAAAHAALLAATSASSSSSTTTITTPSRRSNVPIVGPAGAKHAFSLLPNSGENTPKKVEADSIADASRVRERVLKRLVPPSIPNPNNGVTENGNKTN